jgi:hypothetical protein
MVKHGVISFQRLLGGMEVSGLPDAPTALCPTEEPLQGDWVVLRACQDKRSSRKAPLTVYKRKSATE